MHVVCAIVFLVFTFCYLWNYQADLLAMAQHVLSGEKTVYNRDLGAFLITTVLFLISIGVFAITGIERRNHTLIYFPSLLLLTVLTDVSERLDEDFSFGWWLFFFPLMLAVFAGVVWMTIQLKPYEMEINDKGMFSHLMWENLLVLIVMFLLVIQFSNHNNVFHYRMKMETLMVQGKYNEAIQVGQKSLDTDSSLTYLRIKALDQTGELGDKLFRYPIVGRGKSTVADGHNVKAMLWQDPKFHYHRIYYKKGRPDSRQLILTRYLLNKDLDNFVDKIEKFYKIDSINVPRHFREALTLYTHLRSNPKFVYHNNVMDADFQDFQDLEKKFKNPVERQSAIRDMYGNTYWYYYQYGK